MKIKPVTYFLCAVTLLLMAISPWLIKSLYREQLETPSYKGILSLWHITDWRAGGSSASFIKKRAAEFESRHPYLFIETEIMSLSEANAALLHGDTPDIISYPLGMDPGFPLSPLPPNDTSFPHLSRTAYPYMYGGYCIIANIDILDEQDVYLSDGWGLRPDELLRAAEHGICFDSESGYSSLPAIALHAYPADEGPTISTWDTPDLPDAALYLSAAELTNGLQAFKEGRCSVAIVSQRQLFELGQLYEQGEAPTYSAFAVGGYTDMVQMIGVAKCDDTQKQTALKSFAQYMVSERVQTKLESIGVFPVISGLEIYTDDSCLDAMYSLLGDNAALTLPENTDALDELAVQAFQGDGIALKKLRQQLRRVS